MSKNLAHFRTPSGIRRPRAGSFTTYAEARTVAKGRNLSGGRGHRALKAQDGSYGVVFRPAVAANRQRAVRSL